MKVHAVSFVSLGKWKKKRDSEWKKTKDGHRYPVSDELWEREIVIGTSTNEEVKITLVSNRNVHNTR